MNFRSPKSRIDRTQRRSGDHLGDETHFLRSLLEDPRLTGAVAPRARFGASDGARRWGPDKRGLIVELGPGTGPVTKALIEHGIAREHCAGRIRQWFLPPAYPSLCAGPGRPGRRLRPAAHARSIQGQPIAAIVSSLPLLNQPAALAPNSSRTRSR